MPITASLGALSYSKSSIDSNWDYWYLETNTNTDFNGTTFDSTSTNLYIGGNDTTLNKMLLLRINENNSYPQLIYNFTSNVFNENINFTSTCIDVTYNTSSNSVLMMGSYQANIVTGFPGTNVATFYSYFAPITTSTVVPSTPGVPTVTYEYYASLPSNSLTYTSMCDVSQTSPISARINWVIYRDYDRLIYRNTDTLNFGTTGPLTVVTINAATNYPQRIQSDTTGNAMITMNLNTNSNLIRKANQTSGGTPYPLYPTIWARTYSFGNIYDSILDSSNNLYFVGSNGTDSVIVQYDTNGNLIWQRLITGVFLKSIKLASSYLYISGTIVSNNNLFVAKYDLSGNIQWQNKLSGATFNGKRITTASANVYAVGQSGSKGFAFKFPNDGTIPGTGTFILNSNSYTYSVATQTETAASYTSSNASTSTSSLALSGGRGNIIYSNNGQTISSVDTEA
jgi:hypothetical protein